MWSQVLCVVAIATCARALTAYTDANNTESASNDTNPVVVTPMGAIRGSWMQSRRGRTFAAYRGIRYAEPPVGNLRFQPPQPLESYSDEVDATEEGPACPMPVEEDYYVDEDCLRLNVYRPLQDNSTSDLLPVMVYIHAGAYYSFSGRSDVAGPHYLMDRDLVVVTLNYRLATLGFLSTGDELAPGNNGFKDQVVALQWIKRNIAAFGGDPDLVTITGCSVGSMSVMLHMISPMSEGLFHRAISMSGSPVAKGPSPSDLWGLAVKQAQLVGCPTNSSEAIIDCLKTKSWKEIADTLDSFFEFGYDPVLLWEPVVEPNFGQEQFLSIQPADAIREGKMHAVPYIISQTEAEFFWKAFTVLNNATLLSEMNDDWDRIAPISFMLPRQNSTNATDQLRQVFLQNRQIGNDTWGASHLGRLYGDSVIGFSVHMLANLMSRYSPQPVYYYEFSYIGNHSHYEDPVTGKPTAAAHHDDLIYLFSLRYRFPDIALTGHDAIMVDRMTAIFYNFARYGDPNPRGDLPELSSLSWPQMDCKDRQYLDIGEDFAVGEKYGEDRFQVWDQLYPV